MDLTDFVNSLSEKIPNDRIYTDKLMRLAYGTDASFYRLIPQVVIKVNNSNEVKFILSKAKTAGLPVTFRAAGTSLSGQAVTDSILLVISRDWNGYKISEDSSSISLEPAVLGSWANLYLKPYNKKIGPDPASINACMIGGIAANNASGMCCGTADNSYNTLLSMKIIFYDGTELDTADEVSRKNFLRDKPGLVKEVLKLREEILQDEELAKLITKKYKMKNTTGYSLNSLVDFEDPVDIIQHLMIGSEGTLGFISEITYRTVPENPHKASALILFPNIHEASKAVFTLKKMPVDAVELMDRASLRSVEDKDGIPPYLKELDENVASLLVETSALSQEELKQNIQQISAALDDYTLVRELEFILEPEEYSKLWDIRKGLFPSVGAMRNAGTTVIIEDVAFPLDKLADAVLDLQHLFKKYGYHEAIIFGHSLEGNLHFVFNQDFNEQEEVNRYRNFMNEIVEMTAGKYKGSLKAEHGTGRNMAPFVKYEWGSKAYELMKRIKQIFDPYNLLNPGVLINNDENIHVKNLKPMPKAHDIIDKCIECGFCENVCPSRDLTLTPRQRIVVYREISRLERTHEKPYELKQMLAQYEYVGNATCATDGLCKISCPVDIDTGKFIKQLRNDANSTLANAVADVVTDNYSTAVSLLRTGLKLNEFGVKAVGKENIKKIFESLRNVTNNKTPKYLNNLPKAHPGKFLASVYSEEKEKVVYFPSCINRSMGVGPDGSKLEPLSDVMKRVLERAGYQVIFPNKLDNLCCGMPLASKGFFKQADKKSGELLDALLFASAGGKYPVVFDMSPCTKTEKDYTNKVEEDRLQIYDSIEFLHDFVLPKLKINKLDREVMLHTVCSATHMGLGNKLKQIAEMCTTKVIVPHDVTCCGFAGDRGFTFPELNESALHNLPKHISHSCSEGYSSSRTCEIGLSEQSGIDYKSIVYLVDEASS